MTDLVGVREAARALGKNPSTITRYLRNHPELNRGSDGRPAVDLGELRAHRAQNVNELKSRNHAGKLFDASSPNPDAIARETSPEVVPAPERDKLSYTAAKAEREAAAAERAKIELDERRRKLVPRAEVREGAAELGGVLQVALLQLSIDLAEPLATMTEPTEISVLLDKAFRQALDRLSTKLEDIARDMTDAAA